MLKQIKTKILSLISSRGFKRSLFFGGIVFIIMHFGFDTVFAVEPAKAEVTGDTKDAVSSILAAIQFLVGISASLLGAFSGLISVLLDPGFTNGSNFQISGYIKDVWIFMSNMVYLIFAGILIAISFANIVGKGEGDLFELKKALPRFVVGVLIVPFSWWIVQFMVSLSSIMMVSVYSWPMETFPANNGEFEKYLTETEIKNWCPEWTINIQGNFDKDSTTSGSGFIFCSVKKGPKSLKEIINPEITNGKQNIGGVLSIYTYGIMDLESTSTVLEKQLSNLSTLGKLSAKVIFDVIFILVYLIILVALFLALFTRFIMLWIYMMMSPLFGLLYFLGKGKGGDLAGKFNFKEFIALAMVPVYVAAALSFGLMFVLIMGKGFGDSKNKVLINNTIDLGSTKLIITGDTGGQAASIFKDTIGVLGFLMIKGFSIAVLWLAVMAALRSSNVTKAVIEPIEKFGKQVGDFAKQAPMYVPIPGTSGLGVGGKNATFGALTGGVSQGLQEKMNQSTGTSNVRNKLFGDEQSKQLSKDLGNAITLPAGEAFNKMKDIFRNNDEARLFLEKERVAEGMKQAGIEGAEKIRGAKDSKDFIKIATEINNDKANATKGKQIYGKNVDTEEAASITGGNSSTTSSSKDENKKEVDSKTPINVNIIPEGVKDEGKIKISEAQAIADSISNNYKGKTQKEIEDMIRNGITGFKDDEGKTLDSTNANTKKLVDAVLEAIKTKDKETIETKPEDRVIKEPEVKTPPPQPTGGTPPSSPKK